MLLNASQVNLQFSFGPVPIRRLDWRGTLAPDGRFGPGASLYGQVSCAAVPNYSVYLQIAGVCNHHDTLPAYGTAISDAYGKGGANRRPDGVKAGDVTLSAPTASADGEAAVDLAGGRPLPGRQAHRLDPARRRAERRADPARLPHPHLAVTDAAAT